MLHWLWQIPIQRTYIIIVYYTILTDVCYGNNVSENYIIFAESSHEKMKKKKNKNGASSYYSTSKKKKFILP